jgi:hypothetical protein
MKHTVVMGDLRGADIRPPVLFSEFRQLSIADARTFFGAAEKLTDVACPACGGEAKKAAFEKNGFHYHQCAACKSVYVSPRPRPDALDDYYRHSRASRFRAEHFTSQTSEARRRHVLRAHAFWLGRLFDECGPSEARGYADWGTNFPVIFEEVRALELFDPIVSLDPLPGLERACEERGAPVTHDPPSGLGAVTAFEQLEHRFAPAEYLSRAHAMLAPGGMLFLTTKTISGFDLQALWDKAPYIYVPEHLNLLSIDGLAALFERAGFSVVELSTPGQLDLEFVQAAAREDASIRLPSFVRYLLNHRDREAHEDFQAFLQKHRLSSHVRVAAIKPASE